MGGKRRSHVALRRRGGHLRIGLPQRAAASHPGPHAPHRKASVLIGPIHPVTHIYRRDDSLRYVAQAAGIASSHPLPEADEAPARKPAKN